MELIDREALLADMSQTVENSGCVYHEDEIIDCVKYAPTIDAVEVVFCKNCIYRATAKVNCKGFTICPASNMEITDNDYCSYGRKS